ncbi:translation elongation factor P-related protein [Photobacterium aphoticum]|nr:translation elongation factor P-related protein [Photobacterium aphoticum]
MTKRPVAYSYADGENIIFMDTENYDQHTFNDSDIEDEMLFITEDTQGLHVILVDGKVVGLELPSTVELTIVETDPSIKGASASARTKPARLSTGLVVQVPEYISPEDRIVVNTAERKYSSRA